MRNIIIEVAYLCGRCGNPHPLGSVVMPFKLNIQHYRTKLYEDLKAVMWSRFDMEIPDGVLDINDEETFECTNIMLIVALKPVI
jgi:hypothetical protein